MNRKGVQMDDQSLLLPMNRKGVQMDDQSLLLGQSICRQVILFFSTLTFSLREISVLTNDNGEAKLNNSGATLLLLPLRSRAREIPF